MPNKKPSTRLYAILAREANVGAIFRRGPSNHVCLIKWNLNDDSFEDGQWLKGRIYEKRGDLSPDGKRLIYFASKQKPPDYPTWTAISRIPYLTALIFWRNIGTYGGGGIFNTNETITSNKWALLEPAEIKRGSRVPKDLNVLQCNEGMGVIEEYTWHQRLIRDGWEGQRDSTFYKRLCPLKKSTYSLEMLIGNGRGSNDPWHLIEYNLCETPSENNLSLGILDWADWDKNGDLLYAKDGKLFRLKPNTNKAFHYNLDNAIELRDFSNMTFEEKEAPAWALKWK